MEDMAAREPFSETETCNYIDTYVTIVSTPIWLCACIALITYITFKSLKKRYSVTDFEADSAAINITLELKSTINQFSETLNHDIRITNDSQIEKVVMYTQLKVEDTKMALEEHQQDCTVEVLSAIKKTNASLSAEVKSITTRLSETHEESLIYTRQMVEDVQMALEGHQQDCTNEVINEIRKLKQNEHPLATIPDEYLLQREGTYHLCKKVVLFIRCSKEYLFS